MKPLLGGTRTGTVERIVQPNNQSRKKQRALLFFKEKRPMAFNAYCSALVRASRVSALRYGITLSGLIILMLSVSDSRVLAAQETLGVRIVHITSDHSSRMRRPQSRALSDPSDETTNSASDSRLALTTLAADSRANRATQSSTNRRSSYSVQLGICLTNLSIELSALLLDQNLTISKDILLLDKVLLSALKRRLGAREATPRTITTTRKRMSTG